MLTKLSLGGLKSRFRDYAVLFSGLVIASAVFYMFMAMATNTSFLKSNSPIGFTVLIFGFGAVLLAIITLVYIVYANSFLLTMRQREYAMFMMLGAKGSKIGQLIFIETVTVGLIASIVGILIGMVGTTFLGGWLVAMLHAPASHWSGIWVPAIIWTLVFFIGLFVIAAAYNANKLIHTPMLTLLHADQTPNRIKQKKLTFTVQIIAAVILLAIGYYAMYAINTFGIYGIPVALVTIVLGTYFLFNSVFVGLVNLLKRNRRFGAKGLHTFTLSQLSFRIRDYTRILSVVAMLFALALGAITVGLNFAHDIPVMSAQLDAYDLSVVSPNAATQAKIKTLDGVTYAHTYTVKSDDKNAYLSREEIDQTPLQIKQQGKIKKVTAANFQQEYDAMSSSFNKFKGSDAEKQLKVVDATQFAALGQTQQVTVYKLKDFVANYDQIKAVLDAQGKQYPKLANNMIDQKFYIYEVINGMYSGLAFMGSFLGIAFLAMLASTLMFKILSGASYDKGRYLMLQKIGTRPAALRRSIRQEIGTLFLLPGLVGVIHVLFGLQLFNTLLQHPYGNLLLPFGIFFLMYLIYYLLTTWMYQSIVINRNLASK